MIDDRPAPPARPTRAAVVVLLVAALVAGTAGWALGASRSDAARRDHDAARVRDAKRTTSIQREVTRLDAAIEVVEEEAEALEPSITGEVLLASRRSAAPIELGFMEPDDGDAGSVTGLRVMDAFTSANEAEFPGAPPKGSRWLVVGGEYRTDKPESITDACGAESFVTVVFADATTTSVDDQAVVGAPSFSGRVSCLDLARRNRATPYRAAFAVPEGSEVVGLLVGDMYRRSANQLSLKGPISDRLGWIEFDEVLDVGSTGSKVTPIGDEPEVDA
ncbi:MAG: hypothetical protein JWM86_572 [Thermoleophilia bacterium]|nr:hypothetical protein [Thermoleophilia bacterium]